MNSSADIKGFVGRNERRGLHLVERQAGPGLGVRAGLEGVLPARPAPGPQHRGAGDGLRRSTTACSTTRTSRDGGLTDEQLRDAKMILWRGHCSVHGRFTLDSVDEVRERVPGVNVLVHPECRHEVVHGRRLRRLDRVHHPDHRRGAGRLGLGGRHRAESGPPARAGPPGQADHVPRPDGLLLLDDEPDRPAAPGVGAGGAGRRPGAEPDHGRRRTPRTTPGSRSTRCSRCPVADHATVGVLIAIRTSGTSNVPDHRRFSATRWPM